MGKKTSELTGHALNFVVSQIEGVDHDTAILNITVGDDNGWKLDYLTWAQGGPIIEREEIDLGVYRNDCWRASKYVGDSITANGYGPTPLIAAMRCYVVLKLGVAVDIPDELK